VQTFYLTATSNVSKLTISVSDNWQLWLTTYCIFVVVADSWLWLTTYIGCCCW
jgi:hypothetical protein